MFRRSFLIVAAFAGAISALARQEAPPSSAASPGASLAGSIAHAGEPRLTTSSVRVTEPYIALTFDDGPSDKLTPKLLDMLAQHHIHATFFVVGENAAQYPEILRRAVREGHEIGNHSWSHPNFAHLSDEGVRSQIKRTEDAIVTAIGVRASILRPPYGSLTARQKRFIHDDLGYDIILWDVDPLDWKRPGRAVVTSRIVKETHPGSIVLAHDIHAQTIDAMPETLSELERRGFKFVTVSELLRLAQNTPAAAPPASSPANTPANAQPAAMPSPRE